VEEEEDSRDGTWVGYRIIGKLLHMGEVLPTELWKELEPTGIDEEVFDAIVFHFTRVGIIKQSPNWKVSINRRNTVVAYI
jgi:hypothetical protein